MMNSPRRGLTSKALRRDGACSKTEFNYCMYMFPAMYIIIEYPLNIAELSNSVQVVRLRESVFRLSG